MVRAMTPWAADVVLGDGESVHVRPITPADAAGLVALHDRQSRESLYRRYFSPKRNLSETELVHFTTVDMHDRAGLVVERHGELIAWASYERWAGRDDADSAFLVDDAHHGKGIATLLLEHLAAIARSNGIERFTAEVLADNRPMLAVFARAGWPLQRHYDSGVIDLEFDLADTSKFIDSVERREHRADSRAMARLLLPRSIAVVGASDRPGSVGAALWHNVTSAANGPVYAVNPGRTSIGDVACHPTLVAIGEDVSLAVIAVPSEALEAAIDDCIAARVRGALVVTAVDGTDIDLDALVARARRSGVRLVGPSSMGIATSRDDVGLQASLIPVHLMHGKVAVSMQSGSLGASLLRHAERLRLGLSWFVSLGDRSDVSGNDLLQFWDDDDTTTVIAMYTETFGNPRKFARIARRVSLRRPIVAVRTGAAAIGPSGEAMYQQAGLIEVPTVGALLDTVRVLADQPIPTGPRVAVLSNSRSPATLARAAVEAAGLVAVDGPIPIDWRATAADYEAAVRAALADDGADAVLVIHAPPLAEAAAPTEEIDRAAAGSTKPIVVVLLGGGDGPLRRGSTVPAFSFPEPAAAVLGRAYAYGRWREQEGPLAAAPLGVDTTTAAGIIDEALAAGAASLDHAQVAGLLASYGLSMPPGACVAADDAVAAADGIGFPVAVKATQRHLGRSLRSGVALDLADPASVRDAVSTMRGAIGADADVVVVQSMVQPGVDLRVRCTVDERIGPLISVGLGGRQVDLLRDEPVRLAPLSLASAASLVERSRAGDALRVAGIAVDVVADVIVRLGQLADEHHEIASIDVNPLMVSAEGCWLTDVEVRIAPRDAVVSPLRRID